MDLLNKFLGYFPNQTVGIACGVTLLTTILYTAAKSLHKNSQLSLKGRSNLGVVVTGASRGIGFNLAKQFLQKGHRVVISGRTEKSLQEAAKLLNNDPNLFFVVCDVRNPEDCENLVSFAKEKLKNIDIWINNAGVGGGNVAVLPDVDPETMKNCMETNILGSMFCAKYAIKVMRDQEKGGHLFLMEGFGSDGMIRSGMTTYGTSKYAVSYLGKSLAEENKGSNVGIHRIQPGLTVTEFLIGREGKAVDSQLAWVCNLIADSPGNVAKNIVNQVLRVEGTNQKLQHTPSYVIAFKFMTSWMGVPERFFDKDGKYIYKGE